MSTDTGERDWCCPICRRRLRALTRSLSGHCEVHGWQWADLALPRDDDDEEDDDERDDDS